MTKKLLTLAITGIQMAGQVFGQVSVPNYDFEKLDTSSITKTANWKPESKDFLCSVDKTAPYEGLYSLKVSSNTGGNHFFNQEFRFAHQGLNKYKLKCAFKTNNLNGSVKLGARVFDEAGNTVTITQFTLSESKNQGWQIGEGEFITDNSAKLRIFGNLEGTGEAWFDEISIEEIPAPQKYPSPDLMLYIHEYFDFVYGNSIIDDKNFIADLKIKTIYLCAYSIDKNDCYKVLKEYTTKKLNDGHSFFSTPQEWKALMEAGKHPVNGESLHNYPSGKMLKSNIAYIKLPMFVSNDQKLIAQYADTVQSMIAAFDGKDPEGYIIDLSENGGGNCFPMIAGIGPLIGNGVCEMSFSGNGSVSKIIYNEGWTGRDSFLVFQKAGPYHLKNEDKPIAVIYGSGTASSGEVTAISFMGLPNTKSFGQQTGGYSTRIDNFEMSDGAYFNLASGINADRNKNKFGGKIKPDVETKDRESAIAEASKWILDMGK